jgi:ABC-type nitrate/sulfonate/bicarbonate transport system ATPase subunit
MVAQVRNMIVGTGLAAVHVTHDLAEAAAMADRVVGLTELFAGR